jgi:ATP-dependent DNA helicase RecG
MDKVRELAREQNQEKHPWKSMDDMEIMRSAGLYVQNMVTGESGFNLAAVLLFGKPEVIKTCVPGYITDAIYRVDNVDRYDDRDMVDVNLIEAYDRLMDFCLKHMDNRHVLENDISVDARVRIAREVIGNILIHRDYTNAFPAKLIIEKDVLRTENWSKSRFSGPLSISNFSPYPKNPLLASFFVNIGRADTLGSGMRNLYKYTKLYSHAEPILTEGDVFKVVIPLNPHALASDNEANLKPIDANLGANGANLDAKEEALYERLLDIVEKDPHITQNKLSEDLDTSRRTVQRVMDELKSQGSLERIGGTRGYWKVIRQ